MIKNINGQEYDVKVSQEQIKAERDQLIQAFRQKKVTEEGKKKTIKKEYFDKTKWIQITDPFIFLEIFPRYLAFIADEIDEWYIFVKRTYKALLNCKELELRKKTLLDQYMSIIDKNAFKWGVTEDSLQKMNYFEINDLLVRKNVIKDKEDHKKDSQPE